MIQFARNQSEKISGHDSLDCKVTNAKKKRTEELESTETPAAR